jgi:hypothetical protein
MRAGSAVVVDVGLLALIDIEFVSHPPWILVVGKSAAKMAVVAKRFGLRLSATAQPDRCLCRDRDPEMVDQGNGTIELVGTVADDDDACRCCGLAPFVNHAVLNQAVLRHVVFHVVIRTSQSDIA